MKTYSLLFLFALLPIFTEAGEIVDSTFSKNPKNVEFETVSESELGFYVPGFLPWTDGTIGAKGIESGVQMGGDVLFKNLNMLALAGLEGRKGRVGFILEGMYLDLGADGTSPGPLLTTVDLEYEQLIAEATLTYRIVETDRVVVEFLAGARSYYLGSTLGLSPNSSAIATASRNFSNQIVSRSTSAVREELDQRLAGILAGLPTPSADLSAGDRRRLRDQVDAEVDPIRSRLGDRLREGIGSERSGIARSIADSGPIRQLIRDYARARLESTLEERRAQASAAVSAARADARAKAQKKLAQAERKLSRALASRIVDRLDTTVSDSKAWVDPFFGLRGKVQLTDDIYFVARADYGGFGVSSESIYNLYGAIGSQVKENVTVEVGIRSLGVDYRRGGFVFDASFTGPFMGTMIHF